MTYAYITDGAYLCEDCARTQLIDQVREHLIPSYINERTADDDELMLALFAHRSVRMSGRYVPYWPMEAVRRLEEQPSSPDPDDIITVIEQVAGMEADVHGLSDDAFSDSLDGKWCDCGEELSEPLDISTVVSDTWGSETRELWDHLSPGEDERLFWDVAEELGDMSRRSFYVAWRNPQQPYWRTQTVDRAVWETVRKALIKARKYDTAQHANDGCYWIRKVGV